MDQEYPEEEIKIESENDFAPSTTNLIPSEYEHLQLDDCWSDVLENYKPIKKVGEGSYGKVYRAVCKSTLKNVAIKHINDFADHDYGLVKLLREIQIMRQLGEDSHNGGYLPGLIDIIIPENERSTSALKNVFIIMEYEDSDLRNAIL